MPTFTLCSNVIGLCSLQEFCPAFLDRWLRATPSLGFLAQFGGQESPILLQGWPRLLVLYLMKSKQGWRKSSINLFVTNLALTDFQFVLTLPFWAVENALDFKWPFGKAMPRIGLL